MRAAVLFVFFATACVATPATRRPPSVATTRTRPPTPAHWEGLLLPAQGPPVRAATEPDGAIDVFSGSMRVRVHGDTVEWSRDITLQPIAANASSGSHWLFATADGALLRSDTFVGPLTRVGDAPGHWMADGFDSNGRLAARSDDGRLWIGSDEAFRLAPAPVNGPLVDTGFIDERFGVAVIAPGRLFRTLDGGAHFDPVDTGHAASFVVYPNAGMFVLDTTGGLASVTSSGPATRHAGSRGMWAHEMPEETARAVFASAPSENPFARATLLLAGGVLLPDGRIAVVEGGALYTLDRNGALARVADLPGEPCRLQAWGTQLLARCTVDALYSALFTFQNGWHEVHRFDREAEAVPSADGSSLVVIGGCNGEMAPHDETAVCWFDGSNWRGRTLPGRVRVLGVYDETLLYQSVEATREGGEDGVPPVEIVALSGPDDGRPLALDRPGPRLEEAAFTSSGAIAGFARDRDARFVAIGTPGHDLVVRALPAHATRTNFVRVARDRDRSQRRRGVDHGGRRRALGTACARHRRRRIEREPGARRRAARSARGRGRMHGVVLLRGLARSLDGARSRAALRGPRVGGDARATARQRAGADAGGSGPAHRRLSRRERRVLARRAAAAVRPERDETLRRRRMARAASQPRTVAARRTLRVRVGRGRCSRSVSSQRASRSAAGRRAADLVVGAGQSRRRRAAVRARCHALARGRRTLHRQPHERRSVRPGDHSA
jgi:hypothetical protein